MILISKGQLKKVIDEAINGPDKTGELKKDIKRLKNELEDLEFKKRMEEAEIKHLVKMKEEKQILEAQKKEVELTKEFQAKEMKLQTEYHDKAVKLIQEGHAKMQEIYGKIMERLPNVTMAIEKKVRD